GAQPTAAPTSAPTAAPLPVAGAEAAILPPVPWQATLVIMAFLTGVLIAVGPSSAIPFALIGTPVALALAWLLRRHPGAIALALGLAVAAAVMLVLAVIVGVLSAGVSGGKS